MKAYVDRLRRAEFPQVSFYMPGGWSTNPVQAIVDGKRGVREVLDEINQGANRRHSEWKSRTKRGRRVMLSV
jgi:hypothetical protein